MNREALVLYVQNIRDLEVAKDYLAQTYAAEERNFKNTISALRTKPSLLQHKAAPVRDFGIYMIGLVGTMILAISCLIGIISSIGKTRSYRTFTGITITSGPSVLLVMLDIFAFIADIYFIYKVVDINRTYKAEYQTWSLYESSLNFKNEEEKKRAERDQKKAACAEADWRSRKEYLEKEYHTANNTLEDFYSMNIIPLQYRHSIPAICYIYDYISTSEQTLTDALRSQQIEAGISRIERKIDQVIREIRHMIAVTRCAMQGQNRRAKELIEQNEKMLCLLQKTEENSIESAKYMELTANYAKANAYFSLANYLK